MNQYEFPRFQYLSDLGSLSNYIRGEDIMNGRDSRSSTPEQPLMYDESEYATPQLPDDEDD
jgi:hypothetical protein